MEISYLEGEKFKIKTKTGSVVLSPASLTMSHKVGGGEDFVINKPGEYEVEGISVFGYQVGMQTIYVIQVEDLRTLYLGNLRETLSEKMLSELENIDIVIVGMENEGKLGIKEIVELVAKLEPYYVIPQGAGKDKFIASYEHGSRVVKSLSLNKLAMNEDLTEVIVFG
ncbi:MAG: MBL fold metallo-hydrolase [bacterium]